ncbi:hypothetical protein EDD75_2209 [Thermodesulfitimonas autotrophica]|uniref:Uncharacterized protein n=1 Tax=Thermodesulfitimonas autotrophica TaxID=1894989 RepID=A0A3N5AXU9_9THEO|nr:hypothetical protein [Thermodesulfitimonas autotrophica]RPF41988.1 hypothetical protein EDD75_2209 [Thermodesulfitimonas autotrophica]
MFKADADEIHCALGLLFGPGPWRDFCVELRVPSTRMGTIAGYFSDPGELAEWAAKLSGGFRNRKGETVRVSAVYVTLNPLDPALLARCAGRCQPWAKNTAGDADVVARQWLGLDFDPVRPAGVSSSDAEHEAALERARQVRDWLRGLGWPEPVLADSGNGAHLLYRVDLPNTAEATELVRRTVDAVAAFHSGAGVEVDRKVYNAARIWKLYGTLAAKGDNLPDRPHRMARLIEVPESLQPVPCEDLDRVAAMAPQPGNGGFHGKAGFDVGEWLRAHGVEVQSEKSWNGGRLWVLRRCPWDPEHANLSAFVYQDAAGRVAAKCHHNSCAGKGWNDLRDLMEPGWRKKESAVASESRLPGRVAVPEGWDRKLVVVTMNDWNAAREAYAAGNAAIVAFPDGNVPQEAVRVLQDAEEIRAAGKDAARLYWALYPLLAAKKAAKEAAAGAEAVPTEPPEPQPEPSEKRTRVPLNPAVPDVPSGRYPTDQFDFALDALYCEATGKRLEDLPWLRPFVPKSGARVEEAGSGTKLQVVPAAPEPPENAPQVGDALWGDPVTPEEAERVRDAFKLSPAVFRRKWGMGLREVLGEGR